MWGAQLCPQACNMKTLYIRHEENGISSSQNIVFKGRIHNEQLVKNINFFPTIRYGFRGTPLLFVSARPKLGDRQVKLTHVTDWIEKKLKQEFRVGLRDILLLICNARAIEELCAAPRCELQLR